MMKPVRNELIVLPRARINSRKELVDAAAAAAAAAATAAPDHLT